MVTCKNLLRPLPVLETNTTDEMQAVSTSSLFQSAESEQLGTHRSAKALVVCEAGVAQYGYPVQLDAAFDARALVTEGAGADGGRFRVLASKVVSSTSQLWTAEAGGVVRQTDLESGRTVNVYRGAQGPVPTLDFLTTTSSDGETIHWLVTGSWDKALRIYKTSTVPSKSAQTPLITLPNAMDDFVKCVHTFPSHAGAAASTMLAVGGSDKSVKVFDVAPALDSTSPSASQIRCVYQLKTHTRPVNALASLVGLDSHTRIYSADSMGRILESVWNADTSRLETQREILGFETAIYDLRVFWNRELMEGQNHQNAQVGEPFVSEIKEAEDGSIYRQNGVLWAASGDKSVAGYSLSTAPRGATSSHSAQVNKRSTSIAMQGVLPPVTQPFAKVTHPDYVKSVLPLSLFETLDSDEPLQEALLQHGVVTGASDDQLRLFPHSTLDRIASTADDDQDSDGEKAVYEIEGHWNEITTLEPWIRYGNGSQPESNDAAARLPSASQKEYWIVSSGLDGSVRRWNVQNLKTFPAPRFTSTTSTSKNIPMDSWNADSLPTDVPRTSNGASKSFQMTAEEEAELAELMDSD